MDAKEAPMQRKTTLSPRAWAEALAHSFELTPRDVETDHVKMVGDSAAARESRAKSRYRYSNDDNSIKITGGEDVLSFVVSRDKPRPHTWTLTLRWKRDPSTALPYFFVRGSLVGTGISDADVARFINVNMAIDGHLLDAFDAGIAYIVETPAIEALFHEEVKVMIDVAETLRRARARMYAPFRVRTAGDQRLPGGK